ncbi:flagellar assembly protein FliH [Duganella sp. BJB488]|uniref:flagellar assembly protein FliH n=1 Tax=unclassified Duganella TaxID=2636909 RepID=UPI000E34DB65|nr:MULTISPECIES: flagellar assembly protein FliH [unclassified Duganella]NVD73831.1 flagellar assembly protein FliH [Duganella sp. BJB1802]RFP25879.1 flagellar assembly protein FliH [Duganella sp. BJB489]RFP28380.1 flagellar assembly protein FliH [Duganella sp. BJB488]RFP36809.1 flagellar assembly protein FliH [Duganella sp. BJB480]
MSLLPKEQQSAFQRWEMTSFGDERPSVMALREAEQRERDAEQARLDAEQRVQEALMEQQEALEMGPPLPPPMEYPTVEELEAIREEARKDGYDEGHAAGHADALAAGKLVTDQELEHVRAIAANFSNSLHDADQLIANDVLELALQLAKGMLKNAFQVKPELILPIVREAIEYLPVLQQPALLVLHPDDAAVVRAGIGEELDKGGWRVVEDPQVGRGGCKVDTASNQIDATAAARWQRLSHALGKEVDWLA